MLYTLLEHKKITLCTVIVNRTSSRMLPSGGVIMPYRTFLRIAPFLLALVTFGAQANIITATLPTGIEASADYREGDRSQPAVLVLHGFMTTSEFNTVQSIVNQLDELGYTVLAPTLSLNINHRTASLPCSAIHTHTFEGDVAEIDYWVEWLVRHGHPHVILIGHSTGSLQLVAYAANHPNSAIEKVVATSLVNTHQYTPPAIIDEEKGIAATLNKQTPPPLHPYHLVFCNDYTATPASYLSYIRWSRDEVLHALAKRHVPVVVIMGGNDKRFGPDWISSMKRTGITVKVIPGATHFFDTTHEFELLDELENCIKPAPPVTKR